MATETVERASEVQELEQVESSDASAARSLPVPDLWVKGFRGLKDLKVPRLGQVTLVAGKNGVGKTTLLEAIQAFAARCSLDVLEDILATRSEIIIGLDEDGGPSIIPVWESLFWGRRFESNQDVTIGSEIADVELRITIASPNDLDNDNAELYLGAIPESSIVFKIEANSDSYKYIPTAPAARHRRYGRRPAPYENHFPDELTFEVLGPGVVHDGELAELWDGLIDSGGSKKEVIESLSKMYADLVEDLDMVGDRSPFGQRGRRPKVRLAGHGRPMPLKSLGDGAMRIVGYITAVSISGRSLVLVDEIENGIHHTIQPQFWRTLIDAAARYDTQLVATTHSWGCVEAFAHAAVENESVDCSLIRLDDIGDELTVAIYDESNLLSATESGIEVR